MPPTFVSDEAWLSVSEQGVQWVVRLNHLGPIAGNSSFYNFLQGSKFLYRPKIARAVQPFNRLENSRRSNLVLQLKITMILPWLEDYRWKRLDLRGACIKQNTCSKQSSVIIIVRGWKSTYDAHRISYDDRSIEKINLTAYSNFVNQLLITKMVIHYDELAMTIRQLVSDLFHWWQLSLCLIALSEAHAPIWTMFTCKKRVLSTTSRLILNPAKTFIASTSDSVLLNSNLWSQISSWNRLTIVVQLSRFHQIILLFSLLCQQSQKVNLFKNFRICTTPHSETTQTKDLIQTMWGCAHAWLCAGL